MRETNLAEVCPDLMCFIISGDTVMGRPYMDEMIESSICEMIPLEDQIRAAEEGGARGRRSPDDSLPFLYFFVFMFLCRCHAQPVFKKLRIGKVEAAPQIS